MGYEVGHAVRPDAKFRNYRQPCWRPGPLWKLPNRRKSSRRRMMLTAGPVPVCSSLDVAAWICGEKGVDEAHNCPLDELLRSRRKAQGAILLRCASCSALRCSRSHAKLSSLKAALVNGFNDRCARAAQRFAALRYHWTGTSNDVCLPSKVCGEQNHTRAENERLKTVIETCGGMNSRARKNAKSYFSYSNML
jgi:hypothetical protein